MCQEHLLVVPQDSCQAEYLLGNSLNANISVTIRGTPTEINYVSVMLKINIAEYILGGKASSSGIVDELHCPPELRDNF